MAIVTTVGASTANSYVSIAEAEAYLEGVYTDTVISSWVDGLETAQKEARLALAALFVDSLPLRGNKACYNQALEFPRWWPGDDGYPAYEDSYLDYSDISDAGWTAPTIETNVKNAQCEIVWHVVHSGVFAMESMSYPEQEIKSFSLGGSLAIQFSRLTGEGSYAQLSKARLASTDLAERLLNKWIKRVSGGVV